MHKELVISCVKNLFAGKEVTDEEKQSLRMFIEAGFLLPDLDESAKGVFKDEGVAFSDAVAHCVNNSISNCYARRFGL